MKNCEGFTTTDYDDKSTPVAATIHFSKKYYNHWFCDKLNYCLKNRCNNIRIIELYRKEYRK